jgi:Xaa-Pro aminopeptidase
MIQAEIEKVSSLFSVEGALRARARTFEAMTAIAGRVRPGMLEEEAYETAKAVLAEMGSEKSWHRPYVRFGRNTLKKYGEPSEPGVRLGEDDLFFLDIGPVFGGIEGDAGDTYLTGSDPDMARCAADARRVFCSVRDEWRASGKSGAELYAFAEGEAERHGWKLHLEVNGHRLSEFPHALHFKGDMDEIDFRPSPHVWVLEIQIRHPQRDFGAFYEDLLY